MNEIINKKKVIIARFKEISPWTIGQLCRNGYDCQWDYDNEVIILWN